MVFQPSTRRRVSPRSPGKSSQEGAAKGKAVPVQLFTSTSNSPQSRAAGHDVAVKDGGVEGSKSSSSRYNIAQNIDGLVQERLRYMVTIYGHVFV